MIDSNLKHFILFVYSFKTLKPKEKVKHIRTLFGYKDKKAGKTYEHKGLIEQLKGKKLAQNVILIPFENSLKLQEYFLKNNIEITTKEVWLK